METFSALLAICVGNSPVPGEFPAQRPVTRSFDVFFDLRLNKRLSKQSWGWWFETPSRPLWRHRNGWQWRRHSQCITQHWVKRGPESSPLKNKTSVKLNLPFYTHNRLYNTCSVQEKFFTILLIHGNVEQWGCAIVECASETHLKPQSRERSFAHNLFVSHQIVLKFYTEHDIIIAVLCTKFRNDWTTATDVRANEVS